MIKLSCRSMNPVLSNHSLMLVIFALNSGMRLSEILNLTWPGVDLFRKTITVLKSKNKEKRTIPVNRTIFRNVERQR